jgi:hypothetical protein
VSQNGVLRSVTKEEKRQHQHYAANLADPTRNCEAEMLTRGTAEIGSIGEPHLAKQFQRMHYFGRHSTATSKTVEIALVADIIGSPRCSNQRWISYP